MKVVSTEVVSWFNYDLLGLKPWFYLPGCVVGEPSAQGGCYMTGSGWGSSMQIWWRPPLESIASAGTRRIGLAVEKCAASCGGYLYIGLQAGNCRCGNSYGKHGVAPSDACDADDDLSVGYADQCGAMHPGGKL